MSIDAKRSFTNIFDFRATTKSSDHRVMTSWSWLAQRLDNFSKRRALVPSGLGSSRRTSALESLEKRFWEGSLKVYDFRVTKKKDN